MFSTMFASTVPHVLASVYGDFWNEFELFCVEMVSGPKVHSRPEPRFYCARC